MRRETGDLQWCRRENSFSEDTPIAMKESSWHENPVKDVRLHVECSGTFMTTVVQRLFSTLEDGHATCVQALIMLYACNFTSAVIAWILERKVEPFTIPHAI